MFYFSNPKFIHFIRQSSINHPALSPDLFSVIYKLYYPIYAII